MQIIPRELVGLDVPLWALRFDLTTQQAHFVNCYVIDFDPDKAAREAGFKTSEVSRAANKLLRMRKVQEAISFLSKDLRHRADKDRDTLLKYIWDILNADLNDILDENLNPKPVDAWPKIWKMGALKRVKVRFNHGKGTSTPNSIEIVPADKLKLYELMMIHLGMLGRKKKEKSDKRLIFLAHMHMLREERQMRARPRGKRG
ncbi:terminase small subunit [Roseivivax sp. GX 12232]|uniref:terminase small subunit n=1 Tax=Roseivivax sp. GX 12232 TaxID=2900547 RepID=UPI001E4C4E0A|nr:terminase small subunit [Roseivivax sp. GX 12232]MCE0506911.1 terminase small subunit [Roseivivax sp. GX 12232]